MLNNCKLTEGHSNWYLFVFHGNYGLIFNRLRDIQRKSIA